MKRTLASAVLVSSLFFSGVALADVSTEADAAFKQGQDLLAEKKIEQACAAFEHSEKLEPRGGTLLSLAYCHEQQGKIALAYTEYDEALRRLRVGGGRQDRERFALERMGALRAQVVMVTVELSEAVKARNPAVVVVPTKPGESERNVVVGPDRRVQAPLDVDGGEHRIEVRAAGHKPFVATVQVAGSEATPALVTANELESDGTAPVGPSTSPVSGGESPPAVDGSGQRTIGLAVGGAGVVLAAVGGVFGLLAVQCADDFKKDGSCDKDTANVVYANVANVGIGLGAVGIIAGAYLYLSAPTSSTAVAITPSVGAGSGGMSLVGRF